MSFQHREEAAKVTVCLWMQKYEGIRNKEQSIKVKSDVKKCHVMSSLSSGVVVYVRYVVSIL